MNTLRPELKVAVVMRRERIEGPMSRWQPWRWVLAEVVPHEDGFGTAARLLYKNDREERWLHPGYSVELFKDDAEGYHLNASTEAPCWFVLWRMEEEAGITDEPIARPEMVSLSYYDAGRWLDAQETVEQVAAPAAVVEWLRAFVAEHHVDEPKQRRRPESFRSLTDRFGNPASITTEKKSGAGHD
jgi:Protein of unknown function (DUF3305)